MTLERSWDSPVRLFHWSVVLLVFLSWWTAHERMMDWHRRSGYVMVSLVLFRLLWGVFGSATARFSNFVRGPRMVMDYARHDLFRRTAQAVTGHNPLGGWSVLAMLAALLVQTGLGMFAVDVDGIESGPLSRWVSFETGRSAAHAHSVLFNILLGLIALHVAAVVFYLVYKRTNLIAPMLPGAQYRARASTQMAWLLFGLSAVVTWAIVTYGG